MSNGNPQTHPLALDQACNRLHEALVDLIREAANDGKFAICANVADAAGALDDILHVRPTARLLISVEEDKDAAPKHKIDIKSVLDGIAKYGPVLLGAVEALRSAGSDGDGDGDGGREATAATEPAPSGDDSPS